MKTGVAYLLGHIRLAARLVVSVASLRKWYDGPITVFTSRPEAHRIGQLIADDPRLRVDIRSIAEANAGSSHAAACVSKVLCLFESPYDATVFLDADTLVAGPVDELIGRAQAGPLTLTTYGPWTTLSNIPLKPWDAWREAIAAAPDSERWQGLVEYVTTYASPLVNTGVFTTRRDAACLPDWRDLSLIGRELPTPEESALQLLLVRYPHQIWGTQFNCIPRMYPDAEDVRIWHFAGTSHLVAAVCRNLWLPAYDECMRHNVAQLRNWSKIERGN
jgi:hypothetical protein